MGIGGLAVKHLVGQSKCRMKGKRLALASCRSGSRARAGAYAADRPAILARLVGLVVPSWY